MGVIVVATETALDKKYFAF